MAASVVQLIRLQAFSYLFVVYLQLNAHFPIGLSIYGETVLDSCTLTSKNVNQSKNVMWGTIRVI